MRTVLCNNHKECILPFVNGLPIRARCCPFFADVDTDKQSNTTFATFNYTWPSLLPNRCVIVKKCYVMVCFRLASNFGFIALICNSI